MESKKVKVDGMNCNHCKERVENGIRKISGIKEVSADPGTGEVIINGENITLDQVQKSVEEAGYIFSGELT